MKLADYENAAAQLKQYKFTDDPNINGLASMNLGDALSELGKNDEALAAYKKAASCESELFQSDFILRYGLAQLQANDYDGAKASFKEITDKFANTTQANTAQQYLAGLN